MNLRRYNVFHVKRAFFNITHTGAMRIKADRGIILRIVAVACTIAALYTEQLLSIRCIIWCFTQTSE